MSLLVNQVRRCLEGFPDVVLGAVFGSTARGPGTGTPHDGGVGRRLRAVSGARRRSDCGGRPVLVRRDVAARKIAAAGARLRKAKELFGKPRVLAVAAEAAGI